jgi:DNA-binding NarL/FixJ family response regulator
MSETAVRNHVSQVLTEIQVSDRAATALKARESGLGCTGTARSPH